MSYHRHLEDQKRLKKSYLPRCYRVPVWYDENKGIYRKYHFGKANAKGCRHFYKKYSTRTIRRSKETFQEKNKHHRLFDFWWSLF